MKKNNIILVIIGLFFAQYNFGQCDSLRYWDSNTTFTIYDTIGYHIEIKLYLGENKLVMEKYDHERVRILIANYFIDSLGEIIVGYEFDEMILFAEKSKKMNCSNYIYLPDVKYSNYINWELGEGIIKFEYLLKEDPKKTKTYILSLSSP